MSLIITYWNMPRSVDDKGAATTSTYYYGEGKGIISIIGDSNETTTAATVTEYGVGKSLGQKVVWRGSAFYRTTTASTSLSFLNNLVGVFETEVDNVSSDVSEKVWEWK
jgi:hypothetical protein